MMPADTQGGEDLFSGWQHFIWLATAGVVLKDVVLFATKETDEREGGGS